MFVPGFRFCAIRSFVVNPAFAVPKDVPGGIGWLVPWPSSRGSGAKHAAGDRAKSCAR
jgi:hypothetical protein